MVLDGLFRDVEGVGDGLVIHTHISAHLEYLAALLGHTADGKADNELLLSGVVVLLNGVVIDAQNSILGKWGDATAMAQGVNGCIARHDIEVVAK